jgi:ribosomal protein S27AE
MMPGDGEAPARSTAADLAKRSGSSTAPSHEDSGNRLRAARESQPKGTHHGRVIEPERVTTDRPSCPRCGLQDSVEPHHHTSYVAIGSLPYFCLKCNLIFNASRGEWERYWNERQYTSKRREP